MRTTLRKIGNSLGIIIPRNLLNAWGVGEGDQLVVGEHGIHPARSEPAHAVLDELKRSLAVAVASRFSARQIRAHSLANLHRWKEKGVWVSAYDEWKALLENGDDGKLFATMLGRDETSIRLRQSAPYVGLLPRDEVKRLNEEAAR